MKSTYVLASTKEIHCTFVAKSVRIAEVAILHRPEVLGDNEISSYWSLPSLHSPVLAKRGVVSSFTTVHYLCQQSKVIAIGIIVKINLLVTCITLSIGYVLSQSWCSKSKSALLRAKLELANQNLATYMMPIGTHKSNTNWSSSSDSQSLGPCPFSFGASSKS